jgi:uncharacterized protein (DUF983 family)
MTGSLAFLLVIVAMLVATVIAAARNGTAAGQTCPRCRERSSWGVEGWQAWSGLAWRCRNCGARLKRHAAFGVGLALAILSVVGSVAVLATSAFWLTRWGIGLSMASTLLMVLGSPIRLADPGDYCPACGYAREGLSKGATCPECGAAAKA